MESRRAYRRVCRNVVNNKINNKFQLINKLYKQRNSKKLWNVIRRCKESDTCTDAIDLNTLKDYYSNKFASASPGEIPVFLGCPDVDPMHSPKIGYSCCSQ